MDGCKEGRNFIWYVYKSLQDYVWNSETDVGNNTDKIFTAETDTC
jgi:hypothetical protein